MARKFERKTKEPLGGSPTLPIGTDKLSGTSAGFPHVVELDIDRVRRNPDQPRRHFDEGELHSLAASIDRYGLQNPILVQPLPQGNYLLIGGERRVRAHEILGCKTVFAILTSGDPDEIGLIDNVQRVDLNAVEYAAALARLVEKHGYTHDELAAVVGKDRTDITKLLAILSLPACAVGVCGVLHACVAVGADRDRGGAERPAAGAVGAGEGGRVGQSRPSGQARPRARLLRPQTAHLLDTAHRERLLQLRLEIDAILQDAG